MLLTRCLKPQADEDFPFMTMSNSLGVLKASLRGIVDWLRWSPAASRSTTTMVECSVTSKTHHHMEVICSRYTCWYLQWKISVGSPQIKMTYSNIYLFISCCSRFIEIYYSVCYICSPLGQAATTVDHNTQWHGDGLLHWPQNWQHLVCSTLDQWSGRFLGIIGWDPSVCKSNRLHVDILQFSCIKLGYILYIFLKWLVVFPEVSNFNWLVLKLNRFICN